MIINNDGKFSKQELELGNEYFQGEIKQTKRTINYYSEIVKEQKKELKQIEKKYQKFMEENKKGKN